MIGSHQPGPTNIRLLERKLEETSLLARRVGRNGPKSRNESVGTFSVHLVAERSSCNGGTSICFCFREVLSPFIRGILTRRAVSP